MVNHIEWAFKVWREQPWGKNVDFETFREYILPYRIGDEPLSFGAKKFMSAIARFWMNSGRQMRLIILRLPPSC